MDINTLKTEALRLAILQILADDSNYSVNSSMLKTILANAYAEATSTDKLNMELSWLEEQRLVTLQELPVCTKVTLSQRGLDIAQGAVAAPGIARIGIS